MKSEKYDLVGAIMDYEDDNLDSDGILKLFSYLVKTGKAWSLQGSYGRMAERLIGGGYLDKSGKILKGGEFHEDEDITGSKD